MNFFKPQNSELKKINRRNFLSFVSKGTAAMTVMPAGICGLPQKASGTGLVYDPGYLEHIIDRSHPESPLRLQTLYQKFKDTGILNDMTLIDPVDDPYEAIRLIHSQRHIDGIKEIPVTGKIAALAVSGAMGAIHAVASGQQRNAFCAIRPPGHHALNTAQEEGFCFYNNIAVAARYAQKEFNLEKVLVIDWDYHHGNGTEWAFYEDPSVLFFSTHDWHAYPGSGDPRRRGKGAGEGFTINGHLGFGAEDDDIYRAWDEKLLPVVEKFKPDIVLISAGFDSRKDDLLGCFNLTDLCFSRLTQMAMNIADTHCNGKLVSFLEGGYNVYGLAEAGTAHVMALMGKS
jgi:acetoin utilization deacetylase AcuC-like enzyme